MNDKVNFTEATVTVEVSVIVITVVTENVVNLKDSSKPYSFCSLKSP